MKVKELITELQKLDPTGELYVDGLEYVDRLPGYYDGVGLKVLVDEIEYSDKEDKIRLYNIDILSALERNMKITLNVSGPRKKLYEDFINESKQKLNEIYMEFHKKPYNNPEQLK